MQEKRAELMPAGRFAILAAVALLTITSLYFALTGLVISPYFHGQTPFAIGALSDSIFALALAVLTFVGFRWYLRSWEQSSRMLKESEERASKAFESATLGMAIVGLDGRFIKVNPAVCRIWGYSEEELLGTGFQPLTHPDDLELSKGWHDKLRSGEVQKARYEKRYLHKDGHIVWTSLSSSVVNDTQGRPLYILTEVEDVSDQKAAEAEIGRLNRLRGFLQETNQAMVRTHDRQKLFEEACHIAVEHAGFRMAWVGVPDADPSLIKPVAVAGYEEGYLAGINKTVDGIPGGQGPSLIALRSGNSSVCNDIETDERMRPWRDEAVKRRYKSSGAFPLKVKAEVVGVLNLYADEPGFFDKGEVEALEELAADFSFALDHIQMQDNLKEYNIHLEEMVKQRTKELEESQKRLVETEKLATAALIATQVAQDLRNPLTAIKTGIYYLEEALPKSQQTKVVSTIESMKESLSHATKIANDLVEFSRPADFEMVRLAMNDIVQSGVSSVEIPSNIQLKLNLDPKASIEGDKDKLSRAFQSLINNAIEAEPFGGTIEISSAVDGDKVIIHVSDTGVGISDENMKKLFTPFFTTKAKGIGLGLPICKRIIETHGGRMEIRSREGEGTNILVTLPAVGQKEPGQSSIGAAEH